MKNFFPVLITMRSEFGKYGEFKYTIDSSWYEFIQDLSPKQPFVYFAPGFIDDVSTLLEWLKPELIILTGGDDLSHLASPEQSIDLPREKLELSLLEQAWKIPLLGVCRGFQIANFALGGNMSLTPGHVGTYHELKEPGTTLETNNLYTNSFHKWGIAKNQLANGLIPLMLHADGTVECCAHVKNPWFFTMWHPERTKLNEPQRLFVIKGLKEILNNKYD